MATTPILGLTQLEEEQAGNATLVNEAMRRFEALGNIKVVDRDLTAPPGSPAEGSIYIPAPTATGVWTGEEDLLQIYINGAFIAITPQEGWVAWIEDEDVLLRYDPSGSAGARWVGVQEMLLAISIPLPTTAEDRTINYLPVKARITQVRAVVIGTSSPSLTWSLRYDADRSAAGTQVATEATTNTTTGSTPSLSNQDVPAGRWLWVESSASGGVVAEVTLTIRVRLR